MTLKLVGLQRSPKQSNLYREFISRDRDITVISTESAVLSQHLSEELLKAYEDVVDSGTMQPIFRACADKHFLGFINMIHDDIAGPVIVIGEGHFGTGFMRFPDYIACGEALIEAKRIFEAQPELGFDHAMAEGARTAKLPVRADAFMSSQLVAVA